MQFSENMATDVERLTWEIVERDPRENIFGFYHYGDRAASQGGGTAVFMWFPTAEDRNDFLASCLPYLHAECNSAEEFDKLTLLLRGALSDLDASQVPVSYNAAMKGIAQVEWLGTLDELCNSDCAFAAKMRRDFREDYELSVEPESPISDAELDEFIEFSQTMGI